MLKVQMYIIASKIRISPKIRLFESLMYVDIVEYTRFLAFAFDRNSLKSMIELVSGYKAWHKATKKAKRKKEES